MQLGCDKLLNRIEYLYESKDILLLMIKNDWHLIKFSAWISLKSFVNVILNSIYQFLNGKNYLMIVVKYSLIHVTCLVLTYYLFTSGE